MKVAVIMPLANQRGGAELLLLHFLRNVDAARVEPVVIFLEDGPLVESARRLGHQAEVIEAGRLRDFGRFRETVSTLADTAKGHGCDCILSWMPKAQLYGSLAARRSGLPAIWYQHGMPSRTHWMDRVMTALPARGILACSQAAADAQMKLLPNRPVSVVHPCVGADFFDASDPGDAAALRTRLGLPAGAPIVGMVARLQRWKGVHVLIRAMSRILPYFPDARAVIVGGEHDLEPGYPDFLNELISEANLNESIIMAGFQENVREWMAAMDVVIHASDCEPFGMVIIEAMALGKPVVAGQSGGPTEIITHGHDGLLTAFEDDAALAEAINKLLREPELANRLGANGRERARNFEARDFARKVERAIESFAERKPASGNGRQPGA